MGSRGQAANPYLADRSTRRCADIIGKLLGAGHPCPYFRSYSLPKLGEHDPSTRALKQPAPALPLELADPAADMRLACAVGHGHLAQTPELGGVSKQLPCGVVHWRLHLYLFYYS